MKPPPTIPNERERLAALDESGLLYSPAEERFDRITRLASHMLDAPMAMVSLVGETKQWFKSAQGLEASETPRDVAFCAHAIAAGDGLVVEDATQDARFADNPVVTGEPHVRAYAGRVIRSPSGLPLGTLCIVDSRPRKFSDDELARLSDLAAIAEAEVARVNPGVQHDYLHGLDESERRKRIDSESRLLNHDAIVELLLELQRRGEQTQSVFSVVLIHIVQSRALAKSLGAEAAGGVMRDAASLLMRASAPGDALGRYDADCFLAIVPGADEAKAAVSAQRLRDAVSSSSVKTGRISIHLTASVVTGSWKPGIRLAALLEGVAASVQGG